MLVSRTALAKQDQTISQHLEEKADIVKAICQFFANENIESYRQQQQFFEKIKNPLEYLAATKVISSLQSKIYFQVIGAQAFIKVASKCSEQFYKVFKEEIDAEGFLDEVFEEEIKAAQAYDEGKKNRGMSERLMDIVTWNKNGSLSSKETWKKKVKTAEEKLLSEVKKIEAKLRTSVFSRLITLEDPFFKEPITLSFKANPSYDNLNVLSFDLKLEIKEASLNYCGEIKLVRESYWLENLVKMKNDKLPSVTKNIRSSLKQKIDQYLIGSCLAIFLAFRADQFSFSISSDIYQNFSFGAYAKEAGFQIFSPEGENPFMSLSYDQAKEFFKIQYCELYEEIYTKLF